ncbi:MAG: hypothetical protein JJT90_18115, partial [Ectothiorhodospiraceae bacterium]|nr:hypothetical protein [Ectothiorhodospiraceae bacterium]
AEERVQTLSRREAELLERIGELEASLLDRSRTLERLGDVVARVELILDETLERLHAAETELGRYPGAEAGGDGLRVR